ncbi:hypothetical protein PENSPDRAFT_31386 [Peniophora sp. CONT]|nr:hypothetical protein PENSPDRAFT_31386 [Peniophora sp. CONT]
MPLELNGFRVHIECEGKVLPLYQKRIKGKDAQCYMPSKAGKTFSVVASIIDPTATTHDGFNAYVWAEGKRVTAGYQPKDKTLTISDVRVGPETKRPLVFAAVQTTDHEEVGTDVDIFKVGLLEIHMYFAKVMPQGVDAHSWSTPTDVANAVVLSERSKKAGCNVIGLGDSTTSPVPSHAAPVFYTGVDKKPDAIFKFQHQPLAMLQAAGIAPTSRRVPAPAPRHSPTKSLQKRPGTQETNAKAGPSKRTRTGSVASRLPSPPLLYEDLDDSSKAEVGPVQHTKSTQRKPRRAAPLGDRSSDSEVDALALDRTPPPPPQERPVIPIAKPNAHAGTAENSMDVDEENINANPPPPASLSHNPSTQITNADARPSTKMNTNYDDLQADVKPYLPPPPVTSHALDDVKPQLAQAQTSVLDRAAQLRAQIATREIRVKRLAEEEQLAMEKAELAQLEAQTRVQQGKGKERERRPRDGVREVVDLTMDMDD